MNVIFLVGIPGSGKTTWTRNFIKQNPGYISLSLDKIRSLLFSLDEKDHEEYYNSPGLESREKLVISSFYTLLSTCKRDLIIDNTNCKWSSIKAIKQHLPKDSNIKFKIFHIGINDAMERIQLRERKVSISVLERMMEGFKNTIENIEDNDCY